MEFQIFQQPTLQQGKKTYIIRFIDDIQDMRFEAAVKIDAIKKINKMTKKVIDDN